MFVSRRSGSLVYALALMVMGVVRVKNAWSGIMFIPIRAGRLGSDAKRICETKLDKHTLDKRRT
jgi:hypothetical protein